VSCAATVATRTVLTNEIAEGVSSLLSVTFVDENAATIASLTTLTMTLYEESTEDIINSRTDSDVSASLSGGVLTLTLAPDDNAMITSKLCERHIALFEYTWSAGSKTGKYEVVFTVRNLTKV